MNCTVHISFKRVSNIYACRDRLTIVIEYDVAVVDRSQFAHSPLLVEVEKTPSALLGIHLANDAKGSNRITIESIASGSIAERYFVFRQSVRVE